MGRGKTSIFELVISILFVRWLWKRSNSHEANSNELSSSDLKTLKNKLDQANEYWDSLK